MSLLLLQIFLYGGILVTCKKMTYDNTDSNSDGVIDAPVDNESVSTGQADIGMPYDGVLETVTWDRPQVSDGGEVVQVPQDEPTIQDALRKVPIHLRGDYTIQVDKSQGPFNEDIFIPPTFSETFTDPGGEGNICRIKLEDQGSVAAGDPDIEVNSITAFGGTALCVIINFGPTGIAPLPDENASWAFFYGKEFAITNSSLRGSARGDLTPDSAGILCYSSEVKIQNDFDFGTDLVERGIQVKRGERLEIDGNNNTISGSVTSAAVYVGSGEVSHQGKLPDAPEPVVAVNNNATIGPDIKAIDYNGELYTAIRTDTSGNTRLRAPTNDEYIRAVPGQSQVYYPNGYEPRPLGDGDGIIVTTPDGSSQYRIRVDNSGNVTTDQI